MLFLPYPDFHPAHAVLPGEPNRCRVSRSP
jgi:hypothetical protein